MRYYPFAVVIDNRQINTITADPVITLDQVEDVFRDWLLAGHDVVATFCYDEKGQKNTPIRLHRINLKVLWAIIQSNIQKGKLVQEIGYMFPVGTTETRVVHWLEDTIGEFWVEDLKEGRL